MKPNALTGTAAAGSLWTPGPITASRRESVACLLANRNRRVGNAGDARAKLIRAALAGCVTAGHVTATVPGKHAKRRSARRSACTCTTAAPAESVRGRQWRDNSRAWKCWRRITGRRGVRPQSKKS